MSDCRKTFSMLVMTFVGVISLICGIIVIPYAESRRNAPAETSASTECFKFPADTYYLKLEKQIWKWWAWEYSISAKSGGTANSINTTFDGNFQMRFPTFNNDLNVKFGDKYVSRTDGKTFSLVSEIDLQDCHNNLLYIMKAGSVFQSFINGFNIDVSLEISANGTVQYYIQKYNLFTSSIDVYNNRSIKVAHLYQNKYSDVLSMTGWTWEITIFDPLNNPIDPSILISIAGSQSFREKDKDGNVKHDDRNNFYIALIVFFALAGFVVVCIIGLCCCTSYKEAISTGCFGCFDCVGGYFDKIWTSIYDCSKKLSDSFHNCKGYGSFNNETDIEANTEADTKSPNNNDYSPPTTTSIEIVTTTPASVETESDGI